MKTNNYVLFVLYIYIIIIYIIACIYSRREKVSNPKKKKKVKCTDCIFSAYFSVEKYVIRLLRL